MTADTLLPHLVFGSTLTERALSSWPWYVTRASGFMAVLLLFGTVIWGIGQITGVTYRFVDPLKSWLIHKAMAFALLLMIAIHVFTILIDKFVDFKLSEVFIPFISQYSNGTSLLGITVGSFAVATGILSMYAIIIIILSSLELIDSKPKTWHRLHYLSYATVIMIFVHGLTTGTDLRGGWLRYAWYGLGLIVVLAIVSRLARAGTLKPRKHKSLGTD